MNQQIVKTDMRSCIQMAMTRIQKTLSDSYTSSSKETPDNTPKQDRSRINRKEKTEEWDKIWTNQFDQINGTNQVKIVI